MDNKKIMENSIFATQKQEIFKKIIVFFLDIWK